MQRIIMVVVKVQKSQTDAEALRLQKENVSPLLIQLRQLEVNEMIDMMEKKWNGGPLPMLDLSAFVKT